jgi:DNA-binding NtrC family response regulator
MVIAAKSPAQPVILFADDEPGLRALALEVLAEAGFEVLAAADGFEALDCLRARPDIQALISDIRMPNMSGMVLAITAQAHNPSLKVALVTGYVDEALRLMELDQWPIWLKPFHIERLPELAAELCGTC